MLLEIIRSQIQNLSNTLVIKDKKNISIQLVMEKK